MLNSIKMLNSGDVVLTQIQFTDTNEVKIRPAVVLFEDYDNVVVAGITSNLNMQGIPLTKKEGAIKESVIKVNYIFTVSSTMVSKILFQVTSQKKKLIYSELLKQLEKLNG